MMGFNVSKKYSELKRAGGTIQDEESKAKKAAKTSLDAEIPARKFKTAAEKSITVFSFYINLIT